MYFHFINFVEVLRRSMVSVCAFGTSIKAVRPNEAGLHSGAAGLSLNDDLCDLCDPCLSGEKRYKVAIGRGESDAHRGTHRRTAARS